MFLLFLLFCGVVDDAAAIVNGVRDVLLYFGRRNGLVMYLDDLKKCPLSEKITYYSSAAIKARRVDSACLLQEITTQ